MKIEDRATYKFWVYLAEWLKTKPTDEKILRKIHEIIDSRSGYHSQTNSEYSLESLEYLIKNNGV